MSLAITWNLLVGAALAAPVESGEELDALAEMSLADLLSIEVTTVTRNEEANGSVPATFYLVTRDIIEARGYTTLVQVLEDLPSVIVAHNANEEAPNWVTVRGITGNDRLVLLRDGVRTTAVSGRPEPLLQGYSLFDVERIEILIGPASALYGADAFSGVVNVITRTGASLDGMTVIGSYGRFGTTHDGAVWGDTFGAVDVMAMAQIYHSDGPELPQYYPEDYAAFLDYQETGQLEGWGEPVPVPIQPWHMPQDAYSVGVKAGLHGFEASYYLSSERWVPAYGATVGQTTFSDEQQFYRDIREILAIRHDVTIGEKVPVRFQTTAARTASWLAPASGFSNLFTGYARTYKAEWGTRYTFQHLVNVPIAHVLSATLGGSYDDLVGMPKSADLLVPYDPAVPTDAQGAMYPGTDIPVSFYVMNDRNIGAVGQIQATLGSIARVTVGTRLDVNRRFGVTVNPRAGLVFTPVRPITAKLLYGEAFLSPTPFASFLHYGSFDCPTPDTCTGGYFHVPNPELEPEKLRTGEGTLRIGWTDDVYTTGTLFYGHASNRIDIAGPLVSGTFLGVEGVDLQQSVNRGAESVCGGSLEAELRAKLGPIALHPNVAYTFVTGDIDLDPIEGGLPNAPMHEVKGTVDLRLGRLVLTPSVAANTEIATTTGGSVPGHVLVDGAARYDDLFGSERVPVDLFLTASNLLDARAYDAPGADNTEFTQHRVPVDPLRIDGGISISF